MSGPKLGSCTFVLHFRGKLFNARACGAEGESWLTIVSLSDLKEIPELLWKLCMRGRERKCVHLLGAFLFCQFSE